MRGLLLWMVALMVLGGSALARAIPEKVEAAEPVVMEHREIIIQNTPTPAPERPDFDLYGLTVCAESNETREEAQIPIFTPEPIEEPAEAETEPEWVYYGNCRITFYDAGPCCCGEWANGYTASGEEAIAEWTVANGDLPFGTMVLIDGHEYCVTDRGVDGDQFDVFVNTHEEAVQRGMYYADVYIKGNMENY